MLPSPLRSSVEAATRAAKVQLRALDHREGWAGWLHALLELRFEGGELLGASDAKKTSDRPHAATTLSETQRAEIQRLVQTLPTHVKDYPELLGWAYQAWQRDTKDTLQKRGARVAPEQVPAVTQLFTDAALVDALLEPLLPRGNVERGPQSGKPSDAESASTVANASAAEASEKTAASGHPSIHGAPFAPPPTRLRLLDPCCGAGHVLLEAFRRLLVRLHSRDGWGVERAVPYLLQHCLFGIELDPLCAQVASLTLALEAKRTLAQAPAAWAACQQLPSPIASFVPSGTEPLDTQSGSNPPHALAQPLGSLLSPAHVRGPQRLQLRTLIAEHRSAIQDAAALQSLEPSSGVPLSKPAPLSTALTLLDQRYDAVVTNVPFLARGKQSPLLRDFCSAFYPTSRHDLANVFLDRGLELAEPGHGEVHVIMPQNWLFLKSYQKQRRRLLEHTRWTRLSYLAEGAFESSGAAGAFAILLGLQTRPPRVGEHLVMERPVETTRESPALQSTLKRSSDVPALRRDSVPSGESRKAPLATETQTRCQQEFLASADARITWADATSAHPPLSEYADAFVGMQTGDDPRYIRAFWELPNPPDARWEPLLGTPTEFVAGDGDSWLVDWRQGRGPLHQSSGARPDQGQQAWNKRGIAIHRMRRIFAYTYAGQRFHQNIAVIVPKNEEHFEAVQAFCHSPAFEGAVRQLDQKLNVTNRTLTAVPFDIAYWTAATRLPNAAAAGGSAHGQYQPPNDLPPHPFRQRSFDGTPSGTHAAEIALASYLGFSWPSAAPHFDGSPEETPWYLCVHETGEALTSAPDSTGVSDDTNQSDCVSKFHRYLQTVAPDSELASASASRLRSWLRDTFFAQHCRSFLERPFLWQLWDGEPDGFSIIVRCHALDRQGLRELIDTPLHAWILGLDTRATQQSDSARARLQTAALHLRQRLEAIYVSEAPDDVFVRWKAVEEQPVGWDPDWNDGVRILLRPFVGESNKASNGGCLLRTRPRLSYGPDRGNDGEMSCWPATGLDAGGRAGDRMNAHHVTLREKARARS